MANVFAMPLSWGNAPRFHMEAYIGASNERLPPICGARPFSEKCLSPF